ncbi:MAG: EAL domain-containing protein, partial [Epsilonproteobacteria bacterium]|nr:EAL domain-containing protein [Campylobacterota bacterium]
RTIQPSITMNLYLGLKRKIQKIVDDVMEHQSNILGITVVSNGEVIASRVRKGGIKDEYFMISQPIYKPDSSQVLGHIHVIYSYEHYNRLMKKYKKLLIIFLAGIAVLLILFSVYLEQLLSPLKRIVAELKNYSHSEPLKFEFSNREDEIGAISAALEGMQDKILSYNKRQELINKELERKVAEKTKELQDRLYIDSLTGLPNRAKLQEDLDALPDATLVILNIDDFKEINDLFGHKTGDRILKTFSARLKELFKGEYPRLYRLSGDEFVLLFPKKMERKDIERFLNLLIEKIERMIFLYGDKEISLRITMGVAFGKEGALEKADIALKKAKRLRKPYDIYNIDDKVVEEQYKKNIEWIKRLKKAIEFDRVVPFYQPIINVHTLKPKGYESLVRIIDDDGVPVSPVEFLNIAKKSRLYFHITKIMIDKTCHYFQDSNCCFSINFSIDDILNGEITKYLRQALDRYDVSGRIILEVVESEGIDNYDAVSKFLFEMKDLGCQIAIDDFGSGYSNFEHVLRLPVDYIKIDGSLVKNIESDPNSQIIISAIVDLAKKKKIKTVIEYVSSKEIFERVKALGVDYVQGYYFSEPEPYVDRRCLVE